ncbi:MAG: ferritin-like domain-containing protein [Planctomycetota bacterium]|jgi:rubrerythrin
MTVIFNAFEVFEIAEQIERNGAKFYRRAAEIFDGPDICKVFLRLAEWEIKHEQTFAGMKKQLSERSRQPRNVSPEERLPDPKVMAGLTAFGIRPEPADELSGKQSEVDTLKMAVQKEKDSIVFYNGLKDFVPAGDAKDKIDDIIKEEMRHIRILNRLQKRKE